MMNLFIGLYLVCFSFVFYFYNQHYLISTVVTKLPVRVSCSVSTRNPSSFPEHKVISSITPSYGHLLRSKYTTFFDSQYSTTRTRDLLLSSGRRPFTHLLCSHLFFPTLLLYCFYTLSTPTLIISLVFFFLCIVVHTQDQRVLDNRSVDSTITLLSLVGILTTGTGQRTEKDKRSQWLGAKVRVNRTGMNEIQHGSYLCLNPE